MFTRDQYMYEKLCSHHEYNMQFVTDRTRRELLSFIGKERIMASTDKYFNDIPLKEWNNLPGCINGAKMKEAGDYLTLAGKVCIFKAVAREIRGW